MFLKQTHFLLQIKTVVIFFFLQGLVQEEHLTAVACIASDCDKSNQKIKTYKTA